MHRLASRTASIGLIVVMLAMLLPLSVARAAGPDLSISISDSPDPSSTYITYTIDVTNAGDTNMTDVVVSTDWQSSVVVGHRTESQGTCAPGQPLVCSLGNLAIGASATILVIIRTDELGPFSATTSASASQTEADTTDNTATATTRMLHTSRMSVGAGGTQSNQRSSSPSISEDGRRVVFASDASNLAPDDTNGVRDIFVYDRLYDTIQRISVAQDGTQANGPSNHPVISPSGNVVVYETLASNIVPNDTNGVSDIIRVEIRPTSNQVNLVSHVWDVFPWVTGNGSSRYPTISNDGSLIAFETDATNLTATDDTNGMTDVIAQHRRTGEIRTFLVSLGRFKAQADGASARPAIGSDYFVYFQSTATNLVAGDTNGKTDIFGRYFDRSLQAFRVSVTNEGDEANGSSMNPRAKGGLVAFESLATNLAGPDTNGKRDVYLRDRSTTQRVSLAIDGTEPNGHSRRPDFGLGGVVFQSDATNLIADDTNNRADIFLRYVKKNVTRRVSVAWDGAQSNGVSGPDFDASSHSLVFRSRGRNIVKGDTNLLPDIFVRVMPE